MGLNVSSGRRRRAMAEINVTPLVDVMLVLLVIFMITAPVLQEGFQVDIPQASETQSIAVADARMIVIAKGGEVLRPDATSTDESYAKLSELVDDLTAWKNAREATPGSAGTAPVVVIVGDKDVRYERLIQVWNAALTAGITQLSFQLTPSAVP
jgi:biopolymer transport protein TolR